MPYFPRTGDSVKLARTRPTPGTNSVMAHIESTRELIRTIRSEGYMFTAKVVRTP